jgi:PAS domain S-box-containing protein
MVDDHHLLVKGMQAIIDSSGHFQFCGSAATIDEGLAAIKKHLPDLVLVDIFFEDKPSGFEFLRSLRREFPSQSAIVVSAWDDVSYVKQALQEGASGYVMKDESHEAMIFAFKQVLSGRKYIKAELAEKIIHENLVEVRENKFRTLAENLPDNIIRYDNKCRVIYANQNMAKTFGVPVESILGKTPSERPNQVLGNPEAYYSKLQKVVETGDETELEMSVNIEKNGIQTHHIRFVPERDIKGKVSGALAIGRNITKYKKYEEELLKMQNHLEEAQRIGQMGSWELNLITNELTWSNEIFRIFEINKNEFGASYRAFLDVVHPDDRSLVEKAFSDSILKRTSYNIEHRLLLSSGRVKYVQEIGEHAFDDSNNPVLTRGTVQDITDRKQLELALADRDQELQSLAQKLIRQNSSYSNLPNLEKLTTREKNVFELTGRGMSYIEIARELNISENTVNVYKNRIKEKLEVRNSTELLHIAMQFLMQTDRT